MKTYVLTTPMDAHGQPLRLFKASRDKAIQGAKYHADATQGHRSNLKEE